MQANACKRCGALVDMVKHVRCLACNTRFDDISLQDTGTVQTDEVRLFSMDGRLLSHRPVTGTFLALLPSGRVRECQTVHVDSLKVVTRRCLNPGDRDYPLFLYEYLT